MYFNPRTEHEKYDFTYYETAAEGGYIQAYDHRLDWIRLNKLQKIKRYGKLLDVGCAFGFFLEKARARGYETMGVEVSKEASQYAVEKLGLKVINAPFDKAAALPLDYFDIITLWHVIEHLDNPFETLVLLKKYLKKDGILVIEVPNEFNSLFMRLRRIKFTKREPVTPPPKHLYWFTPKTLASIVTKSGYHILKIETEELANTRFWEKRFYIKWAKPFLDSIAQKLNMGYLIRVYAERR